ncbi:hypothetical protein [Castellaniella sp.]|uniref:hypothetical protein n=1 Tax=Castellaniella sp. TaxID=1955812 RepID=UPI002AFDFEA1|nr:hypothetical protein [Castellaniella sp.]
MTEDEERQLLLKRIAVYTDLDASQETLADLRWLAETYELGARLTRERGRLGAIWSGLPRDGSADPETDREK